ncbi:MAG: hypothetical protein IRZ03_08285 [Acidobacterium ailaaui]|nr:hypothetical protein [Pseudacidobacterium ailaaui]
MCDFKPGDIVVKKNELGIPGHVPLSYQVVRKPYKKYGQMMVDLIGGTGSRMYSTMYPADQFVLHPKYAEKIKSREVYRDELDGEENK